MSLPAIVVPARLASTRFPRKLLHPVRGQPLLLWVARRLAEQAAEYPLWFAVDSEELASVLAAAGFRSVMTDPALPSGSDRIAAANRVIGAERLINVQADEPLVTRGHILQLDGLLRREFPMATLATRFRRPEDFLNPNQVKVVMDGQGGALYFSRSPLPFPREVGLGGLTGDWLEAHPAFKHLGLYAYDAAFLSRYTSWPPGQLEQVEKLEQLRVLEHGERIGVAVTDELTIGVDTPEDARLFEESLGAAAGPSLR